LSAVTQLAITVGQLLSAIVDNATKDCYDIGSYRTPVPVQFALSLNLVGGIARTAPDAALPCQARPVPPS
jgi:hypothetical protein